MGLRAEKRPARGESPTKDSGPRACTLGQWQHRTTPWPGCAPRGSRGPPPPPSRGRAGRGVTACAGVFAATLLGFFAVGAVLPILPRYVRGPIGSGDLAVGVVVGAFAFTAVVGRPVGGRMADATGRRRVVVAGLLITSAAGLLYLLPLGVGGLVFARLVLGIGDGWVFTAGATWIVDLAPESRRGQAIGMFGLAVWGGLAFGPVL